MFAAEQGACLKDFLVHCVEMAGTLSTHIRCPFVDDSAARCECVIDPTVSTTLAETLTAAGKGVRLCGEGEISFHVACVSYIY